LYLYRTFEHGNLQNSLLSLDFLLANLKYFFTTTFNSSKSEQYPIHISSTSVTFNKIPYLQQPHPRLGKPTQSAAHCAAVQADTGLASLRNQYASWCDIFYQCGFCHLSICYSQVQSTYNCRYSRQRGLGSTFRGCGTGMGHSSRPSRWGFFYHPHSWLHLGR